MNRCRKFSAVLLAAVCTAVCQSALSSTIGLRIAAWTPASGSVIEPSAGSELEERLGGAGKVETDGEGGRVVTITNDIDVANLPIEIPDDFGNVTIDLNGHDLVGGDGDPVIRIVPGHGDGEPTRLMMVTSGGNAIVQGGEGAQAIEVAEGAQDGVSVDVGDGVVVRSGVKSEMRNVALGFEEYVQGTELADVNCSALTVADDESSVLRIEPINGSMGNIDAFTPPFTSAGTNCLSIKTTLGNPCAFTLKEDKSSVEVSSEQPYYVDFLARFTSFDDTPGSVAPYAEQSTGRAMLQGVGIGGIDSFIIHLVPCGFVCYIDDDIMLWCQEELDINDEPIGTNWWVRAGNGSGGTADYMLTSMGDDSSLEGNGDWYRVTFKACRDEVSGRLFFNIFLNGKQVRAGEVTDFPSMTDRMSIATVRFDGQGFVDNIVSYDTPPVCIRNVTARQRWPWNGKVDIACEVTGIGGWTNGLYFAVSAVDSDAGIVRAVSNFEVVGGGAGPAGKEVHTNGNYWIVWDARSDLGEVVCSNMAVRVTLKEDDGHEKVQLWEGGPYWASTNIGAEKPEDYGYYFWWGDTIGYKRVGDAWVASDGSSSNFSFDSANTPTYNTDVATLQSEGWITADGVLAQAHDAAHVQWGGEWRMPTADELSAIIDNCDWSWTTTNGVKGYIVRGRGDYASASIFLPAAGYGIESSLYDAGSYCVFWSSDPDSDINDSWDLYFHSSGHGASNNGRYAGFSVRPVQGFSEAQVATMASAGDSETFLLDTRTGVRESAGDETLTYSALWDGDENATVTIAQDGVALAEGLTGEGEQPWSVQKAGTYTLTHTTYTNGVVGVVESATFNVAAKDISLAQVAVDCRDVTYSGTAFTPPIQSVIWGEKTLVQGTDFTLAYSDNVDAGTATITLTGTNLYNGTYTTNFTIRPRALTQGMVGAIGNHPYTGKAQTPKPMVTDAELGVTLREDVEYTLSYANNTAIGKGIVTVTGKGNYTGSIARTFVIEPSSGSELEESLGGAGKAESDGAGGWIVTITNDVDAANLPIEIPDDLGNVTIDLSGHELIGGDGQSAIIIVPGDEEGEPTQLTIVTSGGDAIVQGGEGAPAIKVADGAQEGVLVNVGAGVTVQGGGDDVIAIDAEVGENAGTVVKATYDMSGAAWNYLAPFTYDGTEKTVEVTGLPSGVTVASYEGNMARRPGTYIANVAFAYDAANYNEPSIADCRWAILPSDEWTGVDLALGFEEYAPGTVLTEDNCASLVLPEGDSALLRIVGHDGNIGYDGEFMQPFTSAGTNGLSIKTTFRKPCAFRLAEGNAGVEMSAGHPYCVDFLAMFTVCDDTPDSVAQFSVQSAAPSLLQSMALSSSVSFDGTGNISDLAFEQSRLGGLIVRPMPGFICYVDDDIMLWRQELYDEFTDEVRGTNWWIRAGNGSGGTTDYLLTSAEGVSLPTFDDDWHRITFKMFLSEDSASLLFNVFIDGRQVRSGDTVDFPSMVTRTSIGTVRFAGQGMVDNIVAREAPPPEIRNVTARQRWPWNGLVDITCEVTGIDEPNDDLYFVLEAVNQDSGSTNRLSHFWVVKDGKNSTDRNVHGNGNYRFLWDAHADFGEVVCTNMVLSVTIKTRERVQLWEDGPYWATTNIGAEEPWESGYYFWWGDTVGYKRENDKWVASDGSSSGFSFDEKNTPTYGKDVSTLQSEGWITSNNVLAPEHDAAQAHWGDNWRMPTQDELSALNSNCDWTWTTTNGVSGYIVRGRGDYVSSSIFLPGTGYGKGISLGDANNYGYYWSSVPDAGNPTSAYSLDIKSDHHYTSYYRRRYGNSARPIQDPAEAKTTMAALAGDSASFQLDTRTSVRESTGEEMLTYSSLWDGDAGATVTIAQDGVAIANGLTGEGELAWSVTRNGIYQLTHTTYTNGVAGGVEVATFVVTGKDVPFAPGDVTVTSYSNKYDGVAHGITVDSEIVGIGYKYAYGSLWATSPTSGWSTEAPTLTDVGSMTVWCEISAPGYITTTNSAKVTITKRDIANAVIAPIADIMYAGVAVEPTPEVSDGDPSIIAATDYEVSYVGNDAPGTATVTLTGRGNYTGTKSATFEILPSSKKVVLDALGGTIGAASVVTQECADVYGVLPTATREGYTFAGWWTMPNGGTRISASTTVEADITLYAIWLLPNCYGIAFDPGVENAEWSMGYQSVGVGKVAKLNPCAFTPPAGKRFAGWRRKDNGRRYDDGMLVFNLISESGAVVVLEAVWED